MTPARRPPHRRPPRRSANLHSFLISQNVEVMWLWTRVRPMYTSDIKNWQHRSMLEHWRRQITDIDFVKDSKQCATTLKSVRANRCGRPPTPPIVVAVGDVVVVRRASSWKTPRRPGIRHDCCDTELKLVLFACAGWHDAVCRILSGGKWPSFR